MSVTVLLTTGVTIEVPVGQFKYLFQLKDFCLSVMNIPIANRWEYYIISRLQDQPILADSIETAAIAGQWIHIAEMPKPIAQSISS